MRDKLEKELLKLVLQASDITMTIVENARGEEKKKYTPPSELVDEAAQAILDLLDKSLPSHKRQVHVEHGEIMPSVAQCKWYFDGYEQGIADVRKVIKETSND